MTKEANTKQIINPHLSGTLPKEKTQQKYDNKQRMMTIDPSLYLSPSFVSYGRKQLEVVDTEYHKTLMGLNGFFI